MKKKFRGYYKLTGTEIQNIWDNGFISLDTNVLFNIYRYSEETRKELLRVIKNFSDQLWLTHHSAFEFHKNRVSVIAEQVTIYDETIKTFNKLENDIIKNLKTPHLSKAVLQKFEKTIKETIKDLEKKKEFYKKLLNSDSTLSSITSIFNNKVGEAFTIEDITKIEKEGEERYKKKIPPGFKDSDKSDNKYGDLIIWKELIKKAKSEKRPFILIIDDLKEDWWLRVQGQTISPRQELSQELFKEAEQVFHLYTPDRFLEFASKTEKVKQQAIDEVREIRQESSSPFYTKISSNIYSKNDLDKQLYQAFKAPPILKEFAINPELIKSIEALKSAGITWNDLNPFNVHIKRDTLAYLQALSHLQNPLVSVPGFTSTNEHGSESRNKESNTSNNKKEDNN